jgi:hypothetical protein
MNKNGVRIVSAPSLKGCPDQVVIFGWFKGHLLTKRHQTDNITIHELIIEQKF